MTAASGELRNSRRWHTAVRGGDRLVCGVITESGLAIASIERYPAESNTSFAQFFTGLSLEH